MGVKFGFHRFGFLFLSRSCKCSEEENTWAVNVLLTIREVLYPQRRSVLIDCNRKRVQPWLQYFHSRCSLGKTSRKITKYGHLMMVRPLSFFRVYDMSVCAIAMFFAPIMRKTVTDSAFNARCSRFRLANP